ncbi:hypothetical protein CLG96_07210 [Sphingomonas oleivorans]|uniref:Uncharacterized protein n=2 Tax=Sphingomonas oleivorans TaxID=1735121 RepID=A0A2T5G0D4_9SPHN|nr:hypothetical protein [Sphingomonas oleivorans]PTQ12431.1 hypothetical protein CLG96_07210 [Sphingomonas oleivorans]
MEAIGRGLIDHSLAKERWTHAAHFAAALWIILRRPDLSPSRDMPDIIRSYNEAVGGMNSDSAGYHETITQASLRAAAAFAAERPHMPLHLLCNALLASPLGRKDWLLAYWTRERLFSTEARRRWIEPDIAPLPFAP